MKKLLTSAIIILVALLLNNVFGQQSKYPFQVSKTGSGNKAIIFIPGFSCSGDVWNDTKAIYEKNYTCYTLTMAGFAGVPAQAGQSFRAWEKGIAEYIKSNKIERPVIIGHSMGGGLALAIAADYPDLVSKIVVVDALPCLAAMMNPSFKAKENNDCSASIAQIGAMTDDQFTQMQWGSMRQLMSDTSKIAQAVQWSLKSDRKTFAEMYCDFTNTDLRAPIAGIKCPALIMLESYFANFKPTIAEQYKNATTAQLVYATKGLHFIMYDDKDWYEQQLATFLK